MAGGLAGDHRRGEEPGGRLQRIEVGPDHENAIPFVALCDLGEQRQLLWILGGDTRLVARRRGGVGHAQGVGERHPRLEAGGSSDVPRRLELAPGNVVALRPDQREHVAFPAVLADQRRREPEAATGLEVGGETKHGGRQEMHLVVDQEPPGLFGQPIEVKEAGGPTAALLAEHRIGGHGDRSHVFPGRRRNWQSRLDRWSSSRSPRAPTGSPPRVRS